MVQESRQEHETFVQMVKDSLRKAQKHTSGLRERIQGSSSLACSVQPEQRS